ncbi:MAG: VWA domain-containing protein, partial [Actinomycetota bacterium]
EGMVAVDQRHHRSIDRTPGVVRGITSGGAIDRPVVALVDGDHPLTTGLDFSQLFVSEARRVTAPPGAEILLGAEGAPLLVRLDEPAPTIYLAFALEDSTLPLDIAFPVLFDRALGDLSGAVTPPARLVVGADLPVDPRVEAVITSPDGTSETIAPGSAFPAADRIGFWRVEQPGREPVTVAVGADRAESAVAPAADLPFEAAFGDADATRDRGRIPWLAPIAVLLLAVLGAEYLLARRRVGVGPRQWRVAVGLRALVAAAVLLALVSPSFDRPANEVATVFLIDASDSMTATGRAQAVGLVGDALDRQPDGTRAGVVVFGRDARLESLIADAPRFDGVTVQVEGAGTDLAAALRLGAATLPNDARGRLVLLSDGRPTTGDAEDEIDRLAADGGSMTTTSTGMPSAASPAVVTLRQGGEVVETRTVDLDPGTNTIRFTDVARDDGVLRYEVDVAGPGDVVDANDIGFAAVPVEGADRVLVVEGRDGTGAVMTATLEAGGLTVDVVAPAAFPPLDALTRYSATVLVDVDRRDLSDGQVAALSASVRDLGRGLVVVGGTQSYALGGYRNSDLEELLPVESEITDPLRRQSVAEVLAIDASGSMGACHCDEEGNNGLGGGNRIDGGVSKTAIARTAAARAIAALAATDEVGVLTMDADDRWVIDLQSAP